MKIVIISALWCPSCLIMISRYQHLKDEFKMFEFQELDFDNNKDEVLKLGVFKTLPVLLVYSDQGQELTKFVGEKSYKELAEKLTNLQNE